MKFKQYLAVIADPEGFIPTPIFRWVIRKNPRKTAREEAIAAKVIEAANPRENITGHFGWGPEEQFVLQQLWVHPNQKDADTRAGQELLAPHWRDVPIEGAEDLFTTVETKHGPMPIPNAVREPGQVKADFRERLNELSADDEVDWSDQ